MLRKLPPLEATEAFLIAARSVSFRDAARQLALSPSALSRRIQLLEDFLGVGLFDRSARGVRLTVAGSDFLIAIEPALETLRWASENVRRWGGPLRVAASQSITVGWLMPRLSALQTRHGVTVEIVHGDPVRMVRAARADIGIVGGDVPPEGLTSTVLLDLEAVVVSSRRLMDGRAPPRCPTELGGYPALEIKTSPAVWSNWLAQARCSGVRLNPVASFDTLQVMYEAAAGGFGLAPAIPLASERLLDGQRLTPCFPGRHRIGYQYRSIALPARRASHDHFETFAGWLKHEVAASQSRFTQLTDLTESR
ncbi:LysR substrate-binding domain-containing protein [uncultured Brevundimonas sp.]|uniref:LysR substrate-binding domain-containing protein n=1 Tax=uncultured Brevundimonas sp. TaxID=213418 RepID=UPI002633F18B|nr:LysR substrate-binding domain-containing protein [uncultured Brevundimonas sp.]